MLILRLPFVPVVASVVGITALIPILGAYIGNIVGVILIITVSPLKALIFSIFLIILQQIEGNLIYPKIVGTRVGLAAHWVLLAVVVGGGIGGVFGILIAVPILATIYHLVKEDVEFKTSKKPADGIERIMSEAEKPRRKRNLAGNEPASEVTGPDADGNDSTEIP
jgi:predicted PurR-regulated permease PerM